MVIAHNMLAMNADRQLGIAGLEGKSSTEKLSSGYRINRAADDAAGLSISEKMRKQIRGLDRAAANIEDGISFVQVADGALGEVHEMLQRVNELAVQAANGTNSETDRQYIDNEVQQLKTEMDRIFQTTTFNEKKIWEGESRPQRTIVGRTMAQAVRITTSYSQTIQITNDNYGVTAYSGYSIHADGAGISISWIGYNGKSYETDKIDWATLEQQGNRFQIGDHFKASDTELFDSAGDPVFDFAVSFSTLEQTTTQNIIDAIDGTGMSASISSGMQVGFENDAGNRVFYAGVSVGSPTLNYSAAYASRANADGTKGETGYDFDANNDSFLQAQSVASGGGNLNQIPANNTTDVTKAEASNERWSFSFYMEGIGDVKATSTSASYVGNERDEDSTAEWHYWYTYPDGRRELYSKSHGTDGTLGGVMDALTGNKGSGTPGLLTSANGGDCTSGGTITLRFNLTADNTYTYGKGSTNSVGSFSITINVNSSDTTQTVLDRINNALNPNTILDMFRSTWNRNSETVYESQEREVKIPVNEYRVDHIYDEVEFDIHSGANTEDKIPIRYELLRLETLGLDKTNVLTQEAATNAIDEIADAIQIVSKQRSRFGAYQNRMEHSYQINQNVSENTQASESQIRDTDMAEEMVKYSNNQVLLQAGQSMLAQANQANQGALSLLG